MRLDEFRTDEEQLDEIIPLIPAIAGGVARAAVGGVGKLAGKAAVGGAKLAAKGVGKLAKGAVKGAGALARGAAKAVTGDDDEPEAPADPNATVGTQAASPKPAPAQQSQAGQLELYIRSVRDQLKTGTVLDSNTVKSRISNLTTQPVDDNRLNVFVDQLISSNGDLNDSMIRKGISYLLQLQ